MRGAKFWWLKWAFPQFQWNEVDKRCRLEAVCQCLDKCTFSPLASLQALFPHFTWAQITNSSGLCYTLPDLRRVSQSMDTHGWTVCLTPRWTEDPVEGAKPMAAWLSCEPQHHLLFFCWCGAAMSDEEMSKRSLLWFPTVAERAHPAANYTNIMLKNQDQGRAVCHS